jgi:hypothetical protein
MPQADQHDESAKLKSFLIVQCQVELETVRAVFQDTHNFTGHGSSAR